MFYGPLLPVWMFVNSLQLIVHIPLLRISIPASANLFLLDYLSFIRLNVGNLHAFLEKEIGIDSDNREDYEVIKSYGTSNGYYNELIRSCGYHVSFTRNLLIVIVLTILVLLTWLILSLLNNWICKNGKLEAHWNNLIVRFLYEMFFEIALCLMLSFAVMNDLSSSLDWLLTISFSILTIIAIIFFSYISFKNGPYIKGAYEP